MLLEESVVLAKLALLIWGDSQRKLRVGGCQLLVPQQVRRKSFIPEGAPATERFSACHFARDRNSRISPSPMSSPNKSTPPWSTCAWSPTFFFFLKNRVAQYSIDRTICPAGPERISWKRVGDHLTLKGDRCSCQPRVFHTSHLSWLCNFIPTFPYLLCPPSYLSARPNPASPSVLGPQCASLLWIHSTCASCTQHSLPRAALLPSMW